MGELVDQILGRQTVAEDVHDDGAHGEAVPTMIGHPPPVSTLRVMWGWTTSVLNAPCRMKHDVQMPRRPESGSVPARGGPPPVCPRPSGPGWCHRHRVGGS